MSHCNITRRDKHSLFEQALDRIAILETEKRLLEEKLVRAESNLDSVFDRVRKRETVWLDYADGERIYIGAVEAEDRTP